MYSVPERSRAFNSVLSVKERSGMLKNGHKIKRTLNTIDRQRTLRSRRSKERGRGGHLMVTVTEQKLYLNCNLYLVLILTNIK